MNIIIAYDIDQRNEALRLINFVIDKLRPQKPETANEHQKVVCQLDTLYVGIRQRYSISAIMFNERRSKGSYSRFGTALERNLKKHIELISRHRTFAT